MQQYKDFSGGPYHAHLLLLDQRDAASRSTTCGCAARSTTRSTARRSRSYVLKGTVPGVGQHDARRATPATRRRRRSASTRRRRARASRGPATRAARASRRSRSCSTPARTTAASPRRCRRCGSASSHIPVALSNQEWASYLAATTERELRRRAALVDRRLPRPEHVPRHVADRQRQQPHGLERRALRRARPRRGASSPTRRSASRCCREAEAHPARRRPGDPDLPLHASRR